MKKQFKLLILILLFCNLFSIDGLSQTTDSHNTFIGYWTTDGSTVRTVIFKDRYNSFQMVKWDSSNGEEKEVLKIDIVDQTIRTTEKMVSTNWVTYNIYSIVNENRIKVVIEGDAEGTIIYLKRLR